MTPGTPVKCYGFSLGNRSRHRQSHGAPARVVRVEGWRVLVRPYGHGKDEWYDLKDVRVWKSKAAPPTQSASRSATPPEHPPTHPHG